LFATGCVATDAPHLFEQGTRPVGSRRRRIARANGSARSRGRLSRRNRHFGEPSAGRWRADAGASAGRPSSPARGARRRLPALGARGLGNSRRGCKSRTPGSHLIWPGANQSERWRFSTPVAAKRVARPALTQPRTCTGRRARAGRTRPLRKRLWRCTPPRPRGPCQHWCMEQVSLNSLNAVGRACLACTRAPREQEHATGGARTCAGHALRPGLAANQTRISRLAQGSGCLKMRAVLQRQQSAPRLKRQLSFSPSV
jgi:hypothetical protein